MNIVSKMYIFVVDMNVTNKYFDYRSLLTSDALLYTLRCLFGTIICYALYQLYPDYPFHWSIVSVVVAISPDNSPSLAIDRMKANLLGCCIGMSLFLIHPPNMFMMCLGVALTIGVGLTFQMQGSIRSALAAIVVLMADQYHVHDWQLALQRLICVIIGCLVALLITLLFNWIFRLVAKRKEG